MSKLCKETNKILIDLQKGNKAKQRELYDLTFNYLKVIALRYAADKNDYEDILQEAYLRAFRYIDSFDKNEDGYNWLCKIVQNVAYDFGKNYSPTEPLENAKHLKIFGEEFNKIASKDAVIRELQKLTAYEQNLIYLKFYEDLPYSEVARKMNSKKSTVHKQILKLFEALKNKLQD